MQRTALLSSKLEDFKMATVHHKTSRMAGKMAVLMGSTMDL
jgi:hypothetical protein